MRKLSSFAICFLLILTLFIGVDMHFEMTQPAKGAVIYVGGGGPGNHSKIQDGIDTANPGDTVFVFNGTYVEQIDIDKAINLVGEDVNTTIIDGAIAPPPVPSTVDVLADWVNITGFTIKNGNEAIKIYSVSNCTISGNNISGTEYGVDIYNSTNNLITNNTISSSGTGIYLYKGSMEYYNANNTVSGNIVRDNWGTGIFFKGICGNHIFDNIIINNEWNGIYSHHGQGNNISNNHISSCDSGIYLKHGDYWNNITGNTISNNNYGVFLFDDSVNNTIKSNNILNNEQGIFFVEPPPPWDNYIYHNNFINNTNQSRDWGGPNYYDDGYPSGGNFWSDYNGSDFFSGPNQDILGSDGIGDTPYFFNFSQDNYPLMEPWGNFTYLRSGWNPISIPRIHNSTNLEDVLSQINGTYRAVQWFNASDKQDPWKHYSTSKPSHLNDLDKIDHTMGLQIYIDDPGGAVLDFEGIIPPQNQTIPFYKGWNMVGDPSLSNKYRPDALNNLVFGTEVDAVWTYNSGAQKWEEVGDLNYFVVGKGYWIHATQDLVWEVPL